MDNPLVSAKGEVVIPKRFRDAAGIRPRSRVSFSINNGKLMLEPLRENIVDKWERELNTIGLDLSNVDFDAAIEQEQSEELHIVRRH